MLRNNLALMENDVPQSAATRLGAQGMARVPRVLFADDAVAARVLMSALLRRMNLKVDVAEDGEEVIGLFQCFRFDLILLDIDMPVMDGLATARRIREIEKAKQRTKRTPIIAVSGYLSQVGGQLQAQGDFDGTVPKPVTIARLWSAMAGLLPEGHACTEGSSVVRIGRSEMPLIDLTWMRDGLSGDAADITPAMLERAISDLRGLAAGLERSMAAGGDRDGIYAKAVDLERLSARIGAARLQRAAVVLENLVHELSGEELQVRARNVVTCALATISEFKKLAALAG